MQAALNIAIKGVVYRSPTLVQRHFNWLAQPHTFRSGASWLPKHVLCENGLPIVTLHDIVRIIYIDSIDGGGLIACLSTGSLLCPCR